MIEGRTKGTIIRVLPEKRFGFVRIGRIDYFFHKDDFRGDWDDLVANERKIPVDCVIVESPKGPRVADVNPIENDSMESDGTTTV